MCCVLRALRGGGGERVDAGTDGWWIVVDQIAPGKRRRRASRRENRELALRTSNEELFEESDT